MLKIRGIIKDEKKEGKIDQNQEILEQLIILILLACVNENLTINMAGQSEVPVSRLSNVTYVFSHLCQRISFSAMDLTPLESRDFKNVKCTWKANAPSKRVGFFSFINFKFLLLSSFTDFLRKTHD